MWRSSIGPPWSPQDQTERFAKLLGVFLDVPHFWESGTAYVCLLMQHGKSADKGGRSEILLRNSEEL